MTGTGYQFFKLQFNKANWNALRTIKLLTLSSDTFVSGFWVMLVCASLIDCHPRTGSKTAFWCRLMIRLENSAHSGQVPLSLEMSPARLDCPSQLTASSSLYPRLGTIPTHCFGCLGSALDSFNGKCIIFFLSLSILFHKRMLSLVR
jgi:hypothetical protein